jgi:hypothetical protein
MIANTAIIAFGVSIVACGPVLILMFTMRYLDFERQLGYFYDRHTEAYKVRLVFVYIWVHAWCSTDRRGESESIAMGDMPGGLQKH